MGQSCCQCNKNNKDLEPMVMDPLNTVSSTNTLNRINLAMGHQNKPDGTEDFKFEETELRKIIHELQSEESQELEIISDDSNYYDEARSNADEYLYNYNAVQPMPQFEEYSLQEVSEPFPDLPAFIHRAIEAAETYLDSLKGEYQQEKTYRLKVKNKAVYFQGSKNAIFGTGYCRMTSRFGEYFEGLINRYELQKGLIVLENGEQFFGPFKNGALHGIITQNCLNGDSYKGSMRQGVKQGYGCVQWSDGSSYKGEFKDDKIEGKGTYFYANGDSYKGHFKNGRKHGHGKFKNTKKSNFFKLFDFLIFLSNFIFLPRI